MLKITNTRVYGLEQSVIACRNAMRLNPPEYTSEEVSASMPRARKLVTASSSGDVKCHDNFLVGIIVQFDVKYPQYWSMEFQRYHFAEIITSSSKMHTLSKMNIEEACNWWVLPETKVMMTELVNAYNADPSSENFMRMLSNCPMGLELFMRVTTNYKQLQTIYLQRRHHRLPEWRVFCKWIEGLPKFDELIYADDDRVEQ